MNREESKQMGPIVHKQKMHKVCASDIHVTPTFLSEVQCSGSTWEAWDPPASLWSPHPALRGGAVANGHPGRSTQASLPSALQRLGCPEHFTHRDQGAGSREQGAELKATSISLRDGAEGKGRKTSKALKSLQGCCFGLVLSLPSLCFLKSFQNVSGDCT